MARRPLVLLIATALAGLVLSPTPSHARLDEGRPACDYCRMIITEPAFGVTATLRDGRTMIFDAIECAAAAALTDSLPARQMRTLTFADHDAPHTPLPLARTTFVYSAALESPMGQGLLAFKSATRAKAVAAGKPYTLLDWKGVLARINQVWFEGKQPMARALAGPPGAAGPPAAKATGKR